MTARRRPPRGRRNPSYFASQGMILPKGLSRAAALKIARKRATKDFRAFSYNKSNGWTVLT